MYLYYRQIDTGTTLFTVASLGTDAVAAGGIATAAGQSAVDTQIERPIDRLIDASID